MTNHPRTTAIALATALLLAGCSFIPTYERPAAPVPATYATTDAAAPGTATAAPWQDYFAEPRLRQLIEVALANNRDLRVAVLNVEKARAQYRIQRADRVPAVGVQGQMTRTGGDAPVTEQFSANLGVVEFELDLFGRVRNLSQAALQQYFSEAANRRSAQLSLVAEVANAWLTLGADNEQLRIAQATLASYEDSLRLAEARHQLGGASSLELSQTRTLVETARTDVARFAGQVAQDRNALVLLAGGPVDDTLLPATEVTEIAAVRPLPAGVPGEVLLRRPDVMAAEHTLLSANANIGAARAAFFPSISLTASSGTASNELSGLFSGGSGSWSFVPNISLPIFVYKSSSVSRK